MNLVRKNIKVFDVLSALAESSINKTIIDKLIKINYFKAYGDVNTLLITVNTMIYFSSTRKYQRKI